MLNEDGTTSKLQDGNYFDPSQQMTSPMNNTMPHTMHNMSMTGGADPSNPGGFAGMGGVGLNGFNDTSMMPTTTMMSPMNNTLSTI